MGFPQSCLSVGRGDDLVSKSEWTRKKRKRKRKKKRDKAPRNAYSDKIWAKDNRKLDYFLHIGAKKKTGGMEIMTNRKQLFRNERMVSLVPDIHL